MIGGARNRNFYNLFPFSKILRVPLEGVPLGAISRRTFFPQYVVERIQIGLSIRIRP
jgi:hypothetical protein